MPRDTPRTCTYEYESAPAAIAPDESVEIPRPDPHGCPHTVADTENNRCLFHHFDPDYPVDQITEQFLTALADETRSPTFTGSQLSGLQLAGETLTTPDRDPIDLRGATIDGDLDLTNATIEVPLLLDDAAIRGSFIATDATFTAPVSLVNADIGSRMFLQGTSIVGGFVANGLDAGLIDARSWTVEGPTILRAATFASNVTLAQSTFDGSLSLRDTSFNYSIDATGATVNGPLVLAGLDVTEDMDLIASRIAGEVTGNAMRVGGDVDWRHGHIDGSLNVAQSEFEAEAMFEALSVNGASAEFSAVHFGGETSFSMSRFEATETDFSEALFDGAVWFPYATFDGDVTFEGATFNGVAHLRDATFERDLSLATVKATRQTYLHGSTIHGDFTAADATFNHVQFSATVHGDATFERARFDEQGIFSRSQFSGSATFDHASFAGGPNFDDTRFTGPTSFEETEFLVEPSFEGTRFAIDPDLGAARYPTPASRDLDDLRKSMILARPETLQNTGLTVTIPAPDEDVIIPAKTSHLIEDDTDRTKLITQALTSLDQREWYQLFNDGLRTARTAVAQLDDGGETVLVFGVRVDPDVDDMSSLIQHASIVGVYTQRDATATFGHLTPDLSGLDYLIPVPTADSAFEAGASVAVLQELMVAMIRQQSYRTAILQKRGDNTPNVNTALLPVLVAAAC